MHRAALPRALLPGRQLLRHHIRRPAVSLPRRLHLHPPPGGTRGSRGGVGPEKHPQTPGLSLTTPLQSPQLPGGGSLVASYDKSGYSHSETALAAIIYVSGEVRPPHHAALGPFPLCPAGPAEGRPPPVLGTPVTQATLSLGQNRDFSGRGPHQQREHQVATIQDSYVLSPCPAPTTSPGRAPTQPAS